MGSSTTKKLHLMQLAAVTECEGTPVLQVAHAALRTNVPSEVRTAVVALAHASKVSDGLDGLGRLQRGLALHLACPCPLTPTVPNMTALQVRNRNLLKIHFLRSLPACIDHAVHVKNFSYIFFLQRCWTPRCTIAARTIECGWMLRSAHLIFDVEEYVSVCHNVIPRV